MKVTYILKNLSEEFYTGSKYIDGLLLLDHAEKYEKLSNLMLDLPKNIQRKIEGGAFRDAVELNALVKGPHTIDFKLEKRRGYNLATFTFTKN